MSELLTARKEFEQNLPFETEQKFLPIFPEALADLREIVRPIEQFYLSHPLEPFSLRFRETLESDGSLRYQATLKDRGHVTPEGLQRLEVEVDISAELYDYYKSPDTPTIRKLRAQPNRNVAVDFIEDGRVLCESEHPLAWRAFSDAYGDGFMEISGDRQADNEWQAHLQYRRSHEGREASQPPSELDVNQVLRDILSTYTRQSPVVVRLLGRSGSGKSTIVRTIQQALDAHGLASSVMSTDDYHRGSAWLTQYNNGVAWSEWDHPIVYDTQTMAKDITALTTGHPVPRRTIDFSIAEPVIQGAVEPTPILIIEGIYAGSPELSQIDALTYAIPTPVATCIGRRLLRDLRERPEFADPATSLRYMLEQAEPMWRNQLSSSRA